jgi:Tfp pilus assembly protein PilF/O-antigen ligase
MFFSKEQLPTHILTFILFILWWAVKYQRKDVSFLSTPLDYFVFGFALIYLLTLPIAINARGAIQEFLKVANYFMVYWLVSQIAVTKEHTRIVLNVLVFSALGVAILGHGAALNLWEVKGGFTGGRIFSTIQYPNSLASYLTGTFFVTLGLFHVSSHKIHRPLYILTAFMLLLTVIFTYSRGGWLIVPVFVILYLIFIPRQKKIEAVIVILALSIVSVAITPSLARVHTRAHALAPPPITDPVTPKPTDPAPEPPKPVEPTTLEERFSVTPGEEYTLTFEVAADGPEDASYYWRVLVRGEQEDGRQVTLAHVTGKETDGWQAEEVIFSIPENVERISVRLDSPLEGTTFTVRSVAVASESDEKELTFTWSRRLPRTLYDRLFGFNVSNINVVTRFRYAQDAWSIVKDYPIIGLGGHGWKSRYFQYQSASYGSSEVHNHFLQVWVETGILGFLLFAGIWVSFTHAVFTIFKNGDQEKKVFAIAIGTGVLAIVSHSLYDFNLSLGAIGIFLWALMGAVRGMMPEVAVQQKNSKLPGAIAILLTATLLVFVVSLQFGYSAFAKGTNYLRRNQPNLAVSYLEKAVKYDTLNSEFSVAFAEANEKMFLQTQDRQYLLRADEYFNRASALDRYHPRYTHLYGSFLVRSGRFDDGLDMLERTVELQPRWERAYDSYARAALNVSMFLLSSGNDSTSAEVYLKKALAMEERLAQYSENTQTLAFAMGQAHYLLGNLEEARQYSEAALRVADDRAAASMILSLIYEQNDDTAQAQLHYTRAQGWEPASVTFYERLKEI